MRLRFALAGALAVLLMMAIPREGRAGGLPPRPPVLNGCACDSPPPPPQLVPTLGPSELQTKQQVAVTFSPKRVKRGHYAKVWVFGHLSDKVTVTVRYKHRKPVLFRGKIANVHSRTYTKTWKVPGKAPLGQAALQVAVKDQAKVYTSTVKFWVTK